MNQEENFRCDFQELLNRYNAVFELEEEVKGYEWVMTHASIWIRETGECFNLNRYQTPEKK